MPPVTPDLGLALPPAPTLPPTEPAPEECVSVHRAAQLTGIHRETVGKVLQSIPHAATSHGSPVWLWRDAKAALDGYRATRPAAGDDDAAIKALRREKLELEVAELKGEVVAKAKLVEAFQRILPPIRALLVQRIGVELPGKLLAGLPPNKVRDFCTATVNQALRELQNFGDAFKFELPA